MRSNGGFEEKNRDRCRVGQTTSAALKKRFKVAIAASASGNSGNIGMLAAGDPGEFDLLSASSSMCANRLAASSAGVRGGGFGPTGAGERPESRTAVKSEASARFNLGLTPRPGWKPTAHAASSGEPVPVPVPAGLALELELPAEP